MKFFVFIILFLLNFSNSFAASSAWQEEKNSNNASKVRVLSSFYKDEKGEKKLILGLHFQLKDGWKIYGKLSDGVGLPPSIDFQGSGNYKKHEIIWPKAILKEEKIGDFSLKYEIYQNEIILPVEVNLKNIENPTELSLKLNYGLCKEVCIPANSEFKIKIENQEDYEILSLIQKYLPNKKLISEIFADVKKIKDEKPIKINQANNKINSITLFYAFFAAFFGGLILNIMPCVLPVLGIKLLLIINRDNVDFSRVRAAFLYTIFGILSCFILFSIFAILIKISGDVFNWGFQFQNPYFLIFLIVILLFFIANMLGLFEIRFDQFIANILNKKIIEGEKKRNIFMPNFLSGIMAVLLATPCSAPFLGSAISFSITQNSSIIFLIFLFMGIGFALPYFALMIKPNSIHLLPKSGSWTLSVKKLMAGFLAATLIWLIYVLSNNIGFVPAILIAFGATLFFACFKIKYKFLQFLAFGSLLITIFVIPAQFKSSLSSSYHGMDNVWQKFDEVELNRLVNAGNVVVVDVTADWCLTCKFNKIRVLRSQEVVDALLSPNVIAMRADITKPNQEAMDFINKHGRYAIPFNAVFGPKVKNGLLTSEVLTKEELLKLIEEAKK